MRKIYNVAGHRFCLEMADNEPMWSSLGNYKPFETEQPEDNSRSTGQNEREACLFHLHVLPSAQPLFNENAARLVLTDSSDDDMPCIELYEQSGGYMFRVSVVKTAPVCCEMLTDSDFSEAQLVVFEGAREKYGRFPVDNALMLLYAFSTACMKTLEMHASVVVKDGRSFLFLGKSGTGKSTHSRQWLSLFSDARLLNDDNPIVRHDAVSGRWRAYGSPWSGKTTCYNNDSAPICAFVLIKQAPYNRCEALSLPEAYAAVYSSTSGLRCNRQMADGLHAAVADIVTSVTCYKLECLPDTNAAHVCFSTTTKCAVTE